MPDSETSEFLNALYRQAKQDDETPAETAKRVHKNLRGISRRELMQAGALGAGGLMGGAGGMAATKNAAADASTSDSDGNVGTPSDPVDVFAEGIDSNSINTESVNSINHVRAGDDLQSQITDNGADTYHIVHPGTYQQDTVEVTSANVTLHLLAGATVKLADAAANNRTVKPTGDNFTVKGQGTIDANGANNSSPNHGIGVPPNTDTTRLTVDGVEIKDPLNIAVPVFDVDDVRVVNCRFTAPNVSPGQAVNVTLSGGPHSAVHIQDNTVESSPENDVFVVDSDDGTPNPIRLVVISGNVINAPWGINQDPGNIWAINIEKRAHSVSISDNHARAGSTDGSGGGIQIRNGGDGVTEDVTVSGNTMVGSGDANGTEGMNVSAPNTTVTGNVVRGFDVADIEVNDAGAVVVGNSATVTDNTGGSATIANNG